MKFSVLIVLLSFFTFPAFSQGGYNTIIGIYGGGGLATSYNYDVAVSGGIDYSRGILYRTSLGVRIFYQSMALSYDNEANSAKFGTGKAGVAIYNRSSYVFFAPKISHSLGNLQSIKFNVNAGVGYNMSGTETMRKWDNRYGAAPGNYDSTLVTTPNINKMLYRVGVGFTEYIHMRGEWWLTVTEDFGFLINNVSTTGNADDPSRTVYSPHNFNPGYVSLLLGFSHTHTRANY